MHLSARKHVILFILCNILTSSVASLLPLIPFGFASIITLVAIRGLNQDDSRAFKHTLPGNLFEDIPDTSIQTTENEVLSLQSFGTSRISNISENVVVDARWKGADLSVLKRYRTNGKMFLDPYPHLVIRQALEPALYRALERSYLSDETLYNLTGLNKKNIPQNFRVDLWASTTLVTDSVPELWKRFVEYHSSPAFFREVWHLFEKEIRKSHNFKKNFRIGTRFRDATTSDVVLDCQIAINTPVTTRSSTRGPHLDGAKEIYAGLLYFRNPKDMKSSGGDLNVCQCLKRRCTTMPKKERTLYGVGDTQFKPTDVRVVSKVDYRANNFVMFINSPTAIHAVTPRSVTPFSRRLVNIIAEQQL
mmetsp:Transcript_25003/g.34459  ORF Transcript_25003/g.34459 Transcript_25003/m.34459 type:complete len:362 (+) Transcript_25003:182-1267(+)